MGESGGITSSPLESEYFQKDRRLLWVFVVVDEGTTSWHLQ